MREDITMVNESILATDNYCHVEFIEILSFNLSKIHLQINHHQLLTRGGKIFLITCNTKKGFVQQYSWKLKVATMSDINQQ